MRVGTFLSYSGGFVESVAELGDYEKAGLDIVFVPEAYGFEAEADVIQDRYLAGKKDDAAAAVPDELVRHSSLIGPAGYGSERVEALRASGVTTLNVTPMAGTAAERVRLIERIRHLADDR